MLTRRSTFENTAFDVVASIRPWFRPRVRAFERADLDMRGFASETMDFSPSSERITELVRPSTTSGGSGAAATTEVQTWPRNGIVRSRRSQLRLRSLALRVTSWKWLVARDGGRHVLPELLSI